MGVPLGKGVVRIRPAMSLLGRKPVVPERPTKLKNFRCPDHLSAYLKDASRELDRTEAEIIIHAIEFDRDLSAGLASVLERIHAVAEQLGMDPNRDMAKVLAALVTRGLDKAEADLSAKKKR